MKSLIFNKFMQFKTLLFPFYDV